MSEPVVTVRGEAQLDCPPDLVSFSLIVHRTADRGDKVRAALATASDQVRALLGRLSAAVEQSSTTELHVAPVFGGRGQSKVQGYRGSFSTYITLHDLSALSEVVLGLAPIADSELDGPFWRLRAGNAVYRQVRLAAIDDARQRADDYAASFEATLVRLVEISDTEPSPFLYGQPQSAARFRSDGGVEPPEFAFEPALQSVSGQVTVRFAMSEPRLSSSAE